MSATSDAAFYDDYRREIERGRLPRANRNGALIVAGLTAGFVALDWVAFRADFVWMLWVRGVCIGVMVSIAVWAGSRFPRASCYTGVLVSGGMLLEVIRVAGGAGSVYAPGLMLLFLGMPVLLPLTARQAAAVITVLIAGLCSFLLKVESLTFHEQLLQLAFPVAAGMESVIACGLLDRMRFADFLQRQEIERARDELAELDVAKSRFTANIHHELRTPLTLTLAPVEAMLAGEFGEVSELQRGYLKTIQSNGLRLLKLINNLLDLAKIEGQQLTVKRRPVRVQALATEIADGARPLAERKGVALRLQGLDALPEINADPEAFEKVLVNLLGNALKFTERGGAITVHGRTADGPEAGGVHLVVADTGAGIPPDQLGRIFDRFAQVDGSSTRRHEGTGIGLSLVKELVSLHGGRVWAESEGLGRGTLMHVVLPPGESDVEDADAVAEALAADGESASPVGAMAGMGAELELDEALADADGSALPAPGGDGLRLAELQRNVERAEGDARPAAAASLPEHPPGTPEVLVVEDNVDMRRLLVHLVGQEFRVRQAPNGRAGLEAVRARAPDLVLTDVMMPEMSGTELCAALKSDPDTSAVPVVLVTSKAEREMKIQGLELGADDYVTKPFHPRELLARVRALVKLRRAQQELAVRNALLESTNEELGAAMGELKEAGAQLVHAERLAAVGEMAAGVAHEINNPVNFALNAARTLRATLDDVREVAAAMAALDAGDAARLRGQIEALEALRARLGFEQSTSALGELAGIVSEGLERTAALVGDLRDFAAPGRAERGPVDLARGLRTTLRLIGHTLMAAGVQATEDLPPGLPGVPGDARALNQVFLNLLKNAAEALEGRGGSIRVSARVEGDAVAVEIADDGPGMAPEARERLFEPFFSTKAGSGRGTGLGLAISRRIVEQHGGRLELASASGAGTRAVVRLPLSHPEPELAPEPEPEDPRAA